MPYQTIGPWWAAITVWGVVNTVNLLQAAGFLSRAWTGETAVNRVLGYGMMALAVPSVAALLMLLHSGAHPVQWSGLLSFLAFIAVMAFVDYVRPREFRVPPRPKILVPYLLLFFGSILLMGLPMLWLSRGLWFITAATTALHLVSMGVAMRAGMA